MSPNARRMPEINLEDFERRLRAAGSAQGGVEDPLEELTRLVNTIANERPRDDRVIDFSAARSPRPTAQPLPPQIDEEPEFAPPPEVYQPAQRSLPATPEDTPPPEPLLLRPAIDELPDFTFEAKPAEVSEAVEPPEAEPAPRRVRRTSWYWKVGGLTAVGLVMIAGAAALKFGGAANGSKAPPMILAADGPNKVAPPDEKTVQSAADTGALLTKDSMTSGPVKVVVNLEQPADMTSKSDSPVALMKDSPIIAPNQAPIMVASAQGMPSLPAAPPAAPPAASAAPQKMALKTVSVRPDGTLITADAGPTATYTPAAIAPTPQPTAKKPDAAPTVTSQPASPTLDLPPAKPTKSAARVNVAKTETTAPTEPVSAPLQLGSANSGRVPTKLRPPEAQTADAQPAATAAPAATGDWAVQLAAPRSEAEAQSAMQRLLTKYGNTLGDTELGVKKAEVNGETIFRVRASGMSKADAASLCQKLKSDGGDCFIARN